MRDLYPGAKVRRGSGEIATVVDAGDYLLPNMLVATSAPAASAPAARSRGVLVQLESGERRDVARSEVTVVVPEHPCRGERDTTEFEAVKRDIEPLSWGPDGLRVREFVPATHEAVAVVLHPWERAREPVTWDEVARATGVTVTELAALQDFSLGEFSMRSEGQPDATTMRTLITVLGGHTSTADDVFFAVWEGWGGDRWDWFPDAAHVFLPARGLWLLRGPIDGALTSVSQYGFEDTLRPLLWWPADRSWTVHTDVDWRWTIVAGSESLVSDLERKPTLEVQRTTFDAPHGPG